MKDYILNLIKNIPDREIPITLDIVMEGGAYNGYYGLGSLLLIKELEIVVKELNDLIVPINIYITNSSLILK